MSKLRRERQAERQRKYRDVSAQELCTILERAKPVLSADDYEVLKEVVETFAFLTQELAAKGTSIDRLRRMLFGASTEKTSRVLGKDGSKAGGDGARASDGAAGTGAAGASGEGGAPAKRPGHGRNGAAAYVGAEKVEVPHASLHSGDACPECQKGKVYLRLSITFHPKMGECDGMAGGRQA